MNYKRIIEETADRAMRRRQDLRGTVLAFSGRLLAAKRCKQMGSMLCYPDGSLLDLHYLNNHQIKWV